MSNEHSYHQRRLRELGQKLARQPADLKVKRPPIDIDGEIPWEQFVARLSPGARRALESTPDQEAVLVPASPNAQKAMVNAARAVCRATSDGFLRKLTEWADDADKPFDALVQDDPVAFWLQVVVPFLCELGQAERPSNGPVTVQQVASACHQLADLVIVRNKSKHTSHADDFMSVQWFQKTYHFTAGQQANCVRALWQAWESGDHSLAEKTIAAKLGSSNERFQLQKVFRKRTATGYKTHPAFGTMIQATSPGCYRLVEPASAPHIIRK